MFTTKVIAITGGTGSFGTHVVKLFLKMDVEEIRIFSRDEKKQEEMRIAINDSRIKFYIGDVRDYDSVAQALRGVDYVYHAAALKQVPSCEFYPLEAVRTNVLGAENVMSAAVANNVKRVVVLSTDKAVYPVNAMGHTDVTHGQSFPVSLRLYWPGSCMISSFRMTHCRASITSLPLRSRNTICCL